ncbi:hypothetical protein [Chryseobacterium sp. G0162]|uniref:hypothetical protein n=1 Tax=Chryseobacterium sp. G0162 TaxID=2487063 RepID=UPI001E5D2C39|nr:hypothetical protein [Chryseobacterium sp. G0162]
MSDIFENYLYSTEELSSEEINLSLKFFQPIHLKKGEFFISKGETCRYIGFIVIGAVKAYAVDTGGKENVTCFKLKRNLSHPFQSLFFRKNQCGVSELLKIV